LQQMVQPFFDRNDPEPRRLEVLEGPTGRRTWSDEAKAAIVAESFQPGARVCDVARKHNLAPQHLTAWRRLAREGKIALPADGEERVGFAALVIEDEVPDGSKLGKPSMAMTIEVETAGVVVRAPSEIDPLRLAGIVAALRDLA
jgi:transposase